MDREISHNRRLTICKKLKIRMKISKGAAPREIRANCQWYPVDIVNVGAFFGPAPTQNELSTCRLGNEYINQTRNRP